MPYYGPYMMMNAWMILGLIHLTLLIWFIWTLSSMRSDLRELVNLTKYRQNYRHETVYQNPAPVGPQPALRPLDDGNPETTAENTNDGGKKYGR